MTILPKKKASKEKSGALLQQQQQQHSQDNGGASSDSGKHQEGAAGGHSPPLEQEEEPPPPGYTPYSTSPGGYYPRHYSSGESSPELPVLSKVRYRGGSAQKKVNPPSPTGSPNCGYNSGEEYDGSIVYFDPEKERVFEEALKQERGFIIKRMRSDGACLFRSVADQVYGDQEMHSTVRNNCMDYMLKNSEYFSQFVTEDFEHYINRKRLDRSYGNYLEMQAIAEMYNRCIEVYQYSTEPINIFFGVYKTDNAPIRLSYHGGVHYNSVVDPFHATIGVGLGLAGHKPGVADKNLMSKAKKDSELQFLEQSMLEDKLLNSDWDATCEAIEQAVARESYLLWLREQEQKTKACVGESSRLLPPQSTPPHGLAGVSLPSPLPSSIPTVVTTLVQTTTTSTTGSKKVAPLRARSRSRSSSRSQSPSTSSPQMGRRSPPKEGHPLSSPKRSSRVSPCASSSSSRRTSPLHSPRSSPVNSPIVRDSPVTSGHTSPLLYHCPSSTTGSQNGSPRSSPVFPRSPHHTPSPPPTPPIPSGTYTTTTTNSRSHDDMGVSPSSSPPPYSLDYESGKVLTEVPYEYSSFVDLPPSAFGLVSWDEDDPELVAVLAASQQEYLDGLKRSCSGPRGAESL